MVDFNKIIYPDKMEMFIIISFTPSGPIVNPEKNYILSDFKVKVKDI